MISSKDNDDNVYWCVNHGILLCSKTRISRPQDLRLYPEFPLSVPQSSRHKEISGTPFNQMNGKGGTSPVDAWGRGPGKECSEIGDEGTSVEETERTEGG